MMKYFLSAILALNFNLQAVVVDLTILKHKQTGKLVYIFSDIHIPNQKIAKEQATAINLFIQANFKATLILDGYIKQANISSNINVSGPSSNINVSAPSIFSSEYYSRILADFIQGSRIQQTLITVYNKLKTNTSNLIKEDLRILLMRSFDYNDNNKRLEIIDVIENILHDLRLKGISIDSNVFLKLNNRKNLTEKYGLSNIFQDAYPSALDYFDYQILNDVLADCDNNIIILCGLLHTSKILPLLTDDIYEKIYSYNQDIVFRARSLPIQIYSDSINILLPSKIECLTKMPSFLSYLTKGLISGNLIQKLNQDCHETLYKGLLKNVKPLEFEDLMLPLFLTNKS